MNIEVVSLAQLALLFLSLFGIVVTWPNKPFRFIGLLLAIQVVQISLNVIHAFRPDVSIESLVVPFGLVIGPAIYFWVRQVVYRRRRWSGLDSIHFIPFLLSFAFAIWPQFIVMCVSLSKISYAIYSIFLIQRYHHAAASMRADAPSYSLNWVVGVLIFVMFIDLYSYIVNSVQLYLGQQATYIYSVITAVVNFIFTCYLIVKAVRCSEFFDGLADYERFGLGEYTWLDMGEAPDSTDKARFARLDALIKAQALYRNPRLSLQDLASQTGEHVRDLSRAITLSTNGNFCDYIHRLRISEICEKIRDKNGHDTNFLNLAYGAGFHSKVPFVRAFKRYVGCSPEEYLGL